MREESVFQPLFLKALAVSSALHLALFALVAFGGRLNVGADSVAVIPVTLVSGPAGGSPQPEPKPKAKESKEDAGSVAAPERESDRMKKPDRSKAKKRAKEEERRIRSAIERIRREAERERASSQGSGASGVVGPRGGGLVGTIASFYLQEIWDSIRRNWSMPRAGVDVPEGARVSILVRISPAGQLISVSVLKPSGYDLLDNSALAAIRKAAPFPAPPSVLVDTLRKEGIEVRFFAEEASR